MRTQYISQIMTRDIQNGQPMYFVHYQKWDKKYAEYPLASIAHLAAPTLISLAFHPAFMSSPLY